MCCIFIPSLVIFAVETQRVARCGPRLMVVSRAWRYNPIKQVTLEGGVSLFDNGLHLEGVGLELVSLKDEESVEHQRWLFGVFRLAICSLERIK